MIDNAKAMHAVVKARLSGDEVDFHSAFGGEEGLRMARELQPDTILLDVEMPLISGFDVCRSLKADAALSAIPVIFLTGMASTEEKIKGLNLGAIDYVTKPFDSAELQARVRASLRTKELVDLLAQRAMVDGLTGLRNRAYFEERLADELALRHRNRAPLACIVADIDHFKSVNDTHGHRCGDLVLRGFAQILQDASRREDIVCRFGGEEFAVLCPGVNADGAQILAERMRAAVEVRTFNCGGLTANITASFGISDITFGESMVETADVALYKAKSDGRNRVVVATSILCAA